MMRISSSSSAQLREIISNGSGNGRNGVVGILLRLLLTFDVRSVADFSPVARGSPKSFKSRDYTGLDTLPTWSRVIDSLTWRMIH